MADHKESISSSAMTAEKAIELLADSGYTTKIFAWFLLIVGFLFLASTSFAAWSGRLMLPHSDLYVSLTIGIILYGFTCLGYAKNVSVIGRLDAGHFTAADVDSLKAARRWCWSMSTVFFVVACLITLLFWNVVGPIPLGIAFISLGYSSVSGVMVWLSYLRDSVEKQVNS